jgi:hypothetical protein
MIPTKTSLIMTNCKEDIELLELAIKDPLADELLPMTPDELPAIKPDSDDKKK